LKSYGSVCTEDAPSGSPGSGRPQSAQLNLGVLVLLHQVFSQTSVISLIVIFLGSVIYGYNDIAFHAEGYFWGSAYCLALVFNNTYIKNTFNKYRMMSDNEKTYYNNLVIFPFNVALMLYEESFE
jgi:hypothetical protein